MRQGCRPGVDRVAASEVPAKAWLRPALAHRRSIVKIIVLLVVGLYAWSFAAQYVRATFIDPPLRNPLVELSELHDLSMRQMRDYTLWINGQCTEDVVQADEVAVRERRESLSQYLH
jgi:hypothetical protein